MNSEYKENGKSRQPSIMQSMGARLREMATYLNANDIHHQILHPPIVLPISEDQNMKLHYSDTYGFSRFKFFNSVIKEFNTNLINNLAYMYRAGIGHQRPFFARDLKSAIKRAPIGKACTFAEEKIFIPFQVVTKNRVQFNIGDPIEISDIPNGNDSISDLLNKQNLNSDDWMFDMKEKTLFSIRIKNRMFKK